MRSGSKVFLRDSNPQTLRYRCVHAALSVTEREGPELDFAHTENTYQAKFVLIHCMIKQAISISYIHIQVLKN